MAVYKLRKINDYVFSVYHAVYAQENIFLSYNWSERTEKSAPNGCGYLLEKDGTAVGGVTYRDSHLSSPFLIPPFCSRYEFFQALINLWGCTEEALHFDSVPAGYCEALERLGAVRKRGECRMLRPTSKERVCLDERFCFCGLSEADIDEITTVVHESHLHGYTSEINGAKKDVETAIVRRFTAFSKTDTLHFGAIIRTRDSNRAAAVCLAGIYPDSPDSFSTIHQVSVLPEYRRNGLAEAMILNSINTAHERSPVITLGVMSGNPAKKLYSKIGFISGIEYYDYILQK